ncbi:hypothetical protein [Dyadobacter sp. CY347]|uniref:hypothetical protein n=1 Tax=Dyadobacter sp. CY347 TaxID=2909336 RepID=UPI001F442C70|nr:hypothetical protein [Dyadobacter sp. CY347]MCF2487528.1 hypothetical protein [Dyadobacter sp. CY347]
MKRLSQGLLCLLLSSVLNHTLLAQKDAPVAGHSAALVDLLKKDYNSIDPEMRGDEIIKDRAIVIAIFKTYLGREELDYLITDLQDKAFTSLNTQYVDSLKAYISAKKQISSVPSSSMNIGNAQFDITTVTNKVGDLSDKLELSKRKYLRSKFKLDTFEINKIQHRFANNNKFVAFVVKQFLNKYRNIEILGTDGYASSNYTSSIQKSIPFIGGDLAFEAAIDGLSRFLAKRIKEEMTTYVIERVKIWLKNPNEDDPFAEFKVLLPRTTIYLTNFQADKITSFPDEIKQYIEDDLSHLIENTANLKSTPRLKKLVGKNPDIDFALEALEIIPNLSKLKNPVDYFKTIENSRNINRWRTDNDPMKFNISNSMLLSGMLAQSMTIIDNGELRFAGKSFLGTYGGEENFYLLYMGLLFQQNTKYYDINFKQNAGSTFNLKNALEKIVNTDPDNNDFQECKKLISLVLTDVSDNAEKVMATATEIKKANKSGIKIGADTIYNFVDAMINLSENVLISSDTLITFLNSKGLDGLKVPSIKIKIQPYFLTARVINDITYDIQKRKYANGLIKALEISGKIASQPQNNGLNIVSKIDQLNNILVSDKMKNWYRVVSKVDSPGKISKRNRTAAKIVNGEFTKMITFYLNNYDSTPLITELRSISEVVQRISIKNEVISGQELSLINSLVNKDDFKDLVISYYSNISVSSITVEIEKGMISANSQYSGSGNPVFSQIEIRKLQTQVTDYSKGLFSNYIVNGKKIESEELENIHRKLDLMLSNNMLSLPDKFNISVNPQVTSLIHFVNDMAVAENAEDIEKAIDAFALPAGSYAIKRVASFNFSVNSYPGILPALERPWKNNLSDNTNMGTQFSIGFTAPVGLSGSWGIKKGNSLGFFIPIIDIGAVTRLRLDNNSATSTLPEFKLKNFLSPGLYLHYGFRKTPLSLNIGAQFGPEIRKVMSGSESVSYESMRIGAGLVLDIPLFNLYTKPKFDN